MEYIDLWWILKAIPLLLPHHAPPKQPWKLTHKSENAVTLSWASGKLLEPLALGIFNSRWELDGADGVYSLDHKRHLEGKRVF